MRQVLSTLHSSHSGSAEASGAEQELCAPLQLVSMAASKVAVAIGARQLEEVLFSLANAPPRIFTSHPSRSC